MEDEAARRPAEPGWVDDSDVSQLAQRIRVGPQELVRAIGGPWHVAWRVPEDEVQAPGTLYIGRVGPTVAILLSNDVDPTLRIGAARGQWVGPATLQWRIGSESSSVTTPPAAAEAAAVDSFLAGLRQLVDAAFAASCSTLVLCRYCGVQVGPAHAMGDERCAGCAARLFGITY